ncbi:MAG: hypothetical protein K2X55_29920 [Burkholderiaceae bacterium]|nr:hypothetical protein [Burkholderiaceae bacterium]
MKTTSACLNKLSVEIVPQIISSCCTTMIAICYPAMWVPAQDIGSVSGFFRMTAVKVVIFHFFYGASVIHFVLVLQQLLGLRPALQQIRQ